MFSTEIPYRVTLNSNVYRFHSYRSHGVWHYVGTSARERKARGLSLGEILRFLEKAGTVVGSGHAVCGGFTGAGQWKWANPRETPKKLLLGLKEETKGSGASGTERGRAFEDEEQQVPHAREEHRNSPVRIEWRLGRVLRTAKEGGFKRQAGPDDKGSGVSIRRAGLHPPVRELLENGQRRMERGESVLGCARPCSRG